MRKLFSALLALTCITLWDPLVASNHDDDNAAAPAVAAASRAPVLNPDDEFSTLPTHVLRQIGDILLENDFQSLGRFLKVSRTTNALKDQIFHTTQTMGTVIIDGKERTVMHYGGANNTKDRVLELLGWQTGNPELFTKDHARDYQDWSKTDLLKLFKKQTLKGALDPDTQAGKAYFQLERLLKYTDGEDVYSCDGQLVYSNLKFKGSYSWKGLLLCPHLRDATPLIELDLKDNQLTTFPGLNALTNLKELHLRGNQLASLPRLNALTNLQFLDLSANKLSSLSGLGAVPNLKCLEFNRNKLSSLSGLGGLTNLCVLDLRDNQLTTLQGLEVLTNLSSLNLEDNELTSLSGLGAVPNLASLKLTNNKLTTLQGLEVLTNLRWLDVDSNELTILPELEALTNLEHITLDKTQTNQRGVLQSIKTLRERQKEKKSGPVCQVQYPKEPVNVEFIPGGNVVDYFGRLFEAIAVPNPIMSFPDT